MYFKLILLFIIIYASNCQSQYVFKNCTTNGLEKWLKLDNTSSCYYVSSSSDRLTWHDANDQCQRMGGQLASIHDQTTNQLLRNITYAFYSYYSHSNSDTKFWIGLNAMAERGTYKWSDGSAYEYSNFPPNDPPNGIPALDSYTYYTQGRCVYYYLYYRYSNPLYVYGYWYYTDCNGEHNYICEATDGIASTQPKIPISAGNCPSDWILYNNNKCIKILNTSLSYTASQALCDQLNGDLISIHSAKEQNFITALIADIGSSPYIGISIAFADGVPSHWSWSDQSKVSYTNWAMGVSDDWCAVILNNEHQTGKWNKTSCNVNRKAICEQPKNISIETPSPNPFKNCTLFPSLSANFIQYRNACYYISKANSEWNDAESECQKMNGSHLVSITSGFEYAFIMYYTSQFTPNTSFWIGLYSQEIQGNGLNNSQSFDWIDDWPVIITYWDEDEPMQRLQSSQVGVYQINGLWKSDDPKQYRKFICKKSNEKLVVNDNALVGNCPQSNWIDVNKKSKYCYWFSLESYSGREMWYTSAFHCRVRNGTLVSIHSMFDLQILKNKFTSAAPDDTWLGLFQTPEGRYIWDDGSAVDFTNWDETDDNWNSNRSPVDYCVSVRVSDLKWSKNQCSGYTDKKFYYICQVPKIYNSAQATPSTVTFSTVSQNTSIILPQKPTTISNNTLLTTATLYSTLLLNSTDVSINTSSPSIGEKRHPNTRESVGLSSGAKAGIIIAVVLVASAIICAAVFALIKYRNRVS